MRTTMNLPDELYRAARVRAAEEGRTVTSLLEQALRDLLESDRASAKTYAVRPLKAGISGPLPFDIDDNAAARDYMDGTR